MAACIFSFCLKAIKNFPGVDITSTYEMNTVYSIEIKHVNTPLHLYMLEMLTPYLFKSNRRKTSQEHPSARSVLKTLKRLVQCKRQKKLKRFSQN